MKTERLTACCQNCRACCEFQLGCINLAWLLVDLASASKAATSAHMPNVSANVMTTLETFVTQLGNDWDKTLPELMILCESEFKSSRIEIDFESFNINEDLAYFGIYFFEIKPKYEFNKDEFIENWTNDKQIIYCPRIIKSRIEFNTEKEWQPLYIGKAENVARRINEHCFQEKHKKTFGLKLKQRETLLDNFSIRVSLFIIDTRNLNSNYKAPLQFVLTNLESAMRNKYKPWIGKQ